MLSVQGFAVPQRGTVVRPSQDGSNCGGLEVAFMNHLGTNLVWIHERHLIFEDIKQSLEWLHIPYEIKAAVRLEGELEVVLRLKCELIACKHYTARVTV